jgi:lipopolysaccharide/colanic/teichoic acid biosynthesis glycosyltransferase
VQSSAKGEENAGPKRQVHFVVAVVGVVVALVVALIVVIVMEVAAVLVWSFTV